MSRPVVYAVYCCALVTLAGCGDDQPRQYIGKKDDYTLQVPGGWKIVDDDRKLTTVRNRLNNKIKGGMKMPFNPDAVFLAEEKAGGMVVISPQPLFQPGTNQEDEVKKQLAALIQQLASSQGVKLEESRTKKIGGVTLHLNTFPTADGGRSLTASCLHNGHFYLFVFSAATSDFARWQPVFAKVVDSISLSAADVSQARARHEADQAGFFTGLWHGVLLPFRAVVSVFTDVEIYADNNCGRGYLIGFVIGLILLLGGGATGGRSRLD